VISPAAPFPVIFVAGLVAGAIPSPVDLITHGWKGRYILFALASLQCI
jgi:Flp pilus assembly protein TadB